MTASVVIVSVKRVDPERFFQTNTPSPVFSTFPFAFAIKIDRMFVEAIGAEGHSKAIIETLIDLAKNMRMEIIAEGVETFDQVTYLRERGISAAQGYIFAPPLPANSFRQLLDAMDPLADADGATKAGGVNAAKSTAA